MAVTLFALMYPKPDKADRLTELLSNMATVTKANEPTVSQYQLLREANPEDESVVFLQLET
ncbi:hypothetical protein MMC08_005687 [Hypocenomyce scalaris]|nr:hypothetical protein [Hypocenomyce scalaris]